MHPGIVFITQNKGHSYIPSARPRPPCGSPKKNFIAFLKAIGMSLDLPFSDGYNVKTLNLVIATTVITFLISVVLSPI